MRPHQRTSSPFPLSMEPELLGNGFLAAHGILKRAPPNPAPQAAHAAPTKAGSSTTTRLVSFSLNPSLTCCQWNDGRRTDGWGRYTRRRKWYRDAELVDCAVSTSSNPSELEAVETSTWTTSATAALNPSTPSTPPDSESQTRKRGFLRRESRGSAKSSTRAEKVAERGVSEDDEQEMQGMDVSRMETEGLWRMGDEMKMGLG